MDYEGVVDFNQTVVGVGNPDKKGVIYSLLTEFEFYVIKDDHIPFKKTLYIYMNLVPKKRTKKR